MVMADEQTTVRRTLQLKFTMPGADPAHMLTMIKASAPFYEMFADAKIRLLQNVDDPGKFVQIMEYAAPVSLESNRQQMASDVRLQGYLQVWRSMVPGAVEIDVYQEIGS
jgi:hypothetical protein